MQTSKDVGMAAFTWNDLMRITSEITGRTVHGVGKVDEGDGEASYVAVAVEGGGTDDEVKRIRERCPTDLPELRLVPLVRFKS